MDQWCRQDLMPGGKGTKRKYFEGDTQKYCNIECNKQFNSDKDIGQYILFGYGNRIESNVRVCVALK